MNTGPVLGDKSATRVNNFDFLRFFAATQVILEHTFALSGNYSGALWQVSSLFFKNTGVGVSIFFIISGFLITKSRLDNPDLFVYIKNRVFRIVPALAFSIFFCVFIIGPFASSLDLKGYFSGLVHIHGHLPRVFESNHLPYIVNGSLWTLKVEAFAYLLVALAGFMQLSSLKVFFMTLFIAFFALDLLYLSRPEQSGFMIGTIYANQSVRYMIFFVAGALFYLYRDFIALNRYLFSVLLLVTMLTQFTAYGNAASYFTLPYMVLYFAYSTMPFKNFGKNGDFSYGLYVLAFPVQQMLQYSWGHSLNNPAFFTLAFSITLILAILSWNLIERPAMRLKKAV